MTKLILPPSSYSGRANGRNGSDGGAKPAQRFCTECGESSRAGAKFCGGCGVRWGAPASSRSHGAAHPAIEALRDGAGAVSSNGAGAGVNGSGAAPRADERPSAAAGSDGAETLTGGPLRAGATALARRAPATRRERVGALVALAAALLAAFYLVFDPFDDSRQVARGELTARAGDVSAVLGGAESAPNLKAIRAVGTGAEARLAAFGDSRQTLAGIGDDGLRSGAVAAAQAERELLAQFARLGTLHPANLKAWEEIRPGITRAGVALERESGHLRRFELGTGVVANPARIQRVTDVLDARIDEADRELTKWKRRYRKLRRQRRARLVALEGYAGSVRGQLATYAGLRADLDEWIERYGSEELPFGRAEEFLSQAISNRQQVRNNLAALQAPLALQAGQARLETVLDHSLRAMENAVDGARECTEDTFCLGEDFRDTVDWREFKRASDEISGEFPSARLEWESGVGARATFIKNRPAPKAPNV